MLTIELARHQSAWVARLFSAAMCVVAIGGVARAAPPAAPDAPTVTIVQWNVENLFDATDDPANAGDDAYTPDGEEQWTAAVYQRKLAHLARIVASQKADIVGVQEVENRRVLLDLSRVLREKHGQDFGHIIQREGPDHRGIDVAILSRLAPRTNDWLTAVPFQREILVAHFEAEGLPLVVIVNHWKSRRGPPALTDSLRLKEAKVVRGEVTRLLTKDPDLAVVVMGDFNDSCDGPSMRDGLRSTLNLAQVLREPEGQWLYNLHGLLPRKARGTHYYAGNKTWSSFDSISVSRSLIDANGHRPGWRVEHGSYAIVREPRMVDEWGRPVPFRRIGRTSPGVPVERIEGYSDHLPVRVRLVLRDGD